MVTVTRALTTGLGGSVVYLRERAKARVPEAQAKLDQFYRKQLQQRAGNPPFGNSPALVAKTGGKLLTITRPLKSPSDVIKSTSDVIKSASDVMISASDLVKSNPDAAKSNSDVTK